MLDILDVVGGACGLVHPAVGSVMGGLPGWLPGLALLARPGPLRPCPDPGRAGRAALAGGGLAG